MPVTYVVGDVHGALDLLLTTLREAGLIDAGGHWSGARARLWFLGDFFDRGPNGIGTLETVMRLQHEAQAAGGRVAALMGNHEPLILAARRFGNRNLGGGASFLNLWHFNGGHDSDLWALRDEHVRWIENLPALARVGETLLMHADATFYLEYGSSLEAVNAAIGATLQSDDPREWDRLLEAFACRREFWDPVRGKANLQKVLAAYGGSRVVHGHTPVPYLTGRAQPEPLVYQGGRCVNVDGGMAYGGYGWVYRLEEQT
ncbi:hypothetical protein HNR42_000682 [Deinobacterium chartae]|uniref:Calcineurin-like phosphoesterase domain-containing protein n=1 Tax=Deinobacterium chartae TaxID=521158 RepID=A0A841HZ56_9DEIO|nr:metallophosphoesterase family protein [Deinobacterium chartae]MBB6097268.1 hypothetical protein [Deinobacterium chartae]